MLNRALLVLAFAAAYWICAFSSLQFTTRAGDLALVWVASGVGVAGMLILRPADRAALLVLIGLASMVTNTGFGGTPVGEAVVYSGANMLECWIAVLCIQRRIALPPDFGQHENVVRFTLGSAIGGACGAFLATLTRLRYGDAGPFFLSWTFSSLLGILVVTPIIVQAVRTFTGPTETARQSALPARIATVIAAAGTAFIGFDQTEFPLLFLSVGSAILAALVGGISAAVTAVFVIAAIGCVMTALGMGPVMPMDGDLQHKVLFFQLYLLTILSCALPVASLLTETKRRTAQLAERNRLLAMAEEKASVGHWRLNIGSDHAYWSTEVYRIHGLPADGAPVPLQAAYDAYHPDDREMVTRWVRHTIETKEPFAFEARLVRPDGTIRHIESTGSVEFVDGRAVALFGTVLDITEKAQAIHQLKEAQLLAQNEALRATRLAETDQLTGIANRRKLLADLDAAVVHARAEGSVLSFVMFDIDDFKAVNDTFGHARGDKVLKTVAALAVTSLRRADLIGRLGGEEFGVILPHADLQTASMVAERIRAATEASATRAELNRSLSVSLGIAQLKPGMDADALMHAADLALYEAKASGKNCYRLAA